MVPRETTVLSLEVRNLEGRYFKRLLISLKVLRGVCEVNTKHLWIVLLNTLRETL